MKDIIPLVMDVNKIDWHKDSILALIACWENYGCLYDATDPHYSRKQSRVDALTKIVQVLKEYHPNITTNDVRTKINYLRGQYTRVVAKGDSDPGAKNLYWYQRMYFIAPHIKSKKKDDQYYGPEDDTLDSSSQVDSFGSSFIDIYETEIYPPPAKKMFAVKCDTDTGTTDNLIKREYSAEDLPEDDLNHQNHTAPQINHSVLEHQNQQNHQTHHNYQNHQSNETHQNQQSHQNHQSHQSLYVHQNHPPSYSHRNHQISAPQNLILTNPPIGRDEAFCQYLRTELSSITNELIKDDLIEKITAAVFEAKKQQRLSNNNN